MTADKNSIETNLLPKQDNNSSATIKTTSLSTINAASNSTIQNNENNNQIVADTKDEYQFNEFQVNLNLININIK